MTGPILAGEYVLCALDFCIEAFHIARLKVLGGGDEHVSLLEESRAILNLLSSPLPSTAQTLPQ